MPDDLYFLCMLHNIGATSTEKSLTVEEISRWTALEPEKVRAILHGLVATHYVQVLTNGGVERYSITVDGIRKVLSMYS